MPTTAMATDSTGGVYLLGAITAVVILAALVGRELFVASGRRPTRLFSVLLTAESAALLIIVTWMSVPRIAEVLRDGPTSTTGGAAPTVSAAQPARTPAPRVTEAFDLTALNTRPDAGWIFSAPSAVQIVAYPTSFDRSLRVTSDGSAADVSACKTFHPVGDTAVRLEADLNFHAQTHSSRMTMTGGGGDRQMAEITLSADGELNYSDAESTRTVGFAFEVEMWYHATLWLHPNQETYDFRIAPTTGRGPVFRVLGAGLIPASVGPVDELCFVVRSDEPATGLLIDDLTTPP